MADDDIPDTLTGLLKHIAIDFVPETQAAAESINQWLAGQAELRRHGPTRGWARNIEVQGVTIQAGSTVSVLPAATRTRRICQTRQSIRGSTSNARRLRHGRTPRHYVIAQPWQAKQFRGMAVNNIVTVLQYCIVTSQ